MRNNEVLHLFILKSMIFISCNIVFLFISLSADTQYVSALINRLADVHLHFHQI